MPASAVGAYLWRPKSPVRAPIDATMFAVCCLCLLLAVFGEGAKDDGDDDDDGPKCGSIHSMAATAKGRLLLKVPFLVVNLSLRCTTFVFFFFSNKLIPPIKLLLLLMMPTKLSVRYLY